jgi:hypothetical protein
VHVRTALGADDAQDRAARAFVSAALMNEGVAAVWERDPKNIPKKTAIQLMVGIKP